MKRGSQGLESRRDGNHEVGEVFDVGRLFSFEKDTVKTYFSSTNSVEKVHRLSNLKILWQYSGSIPFK